MKRTCGVIGGMGPMATADFMIKVIENTKACSDAEHLHMIIDNNTLIPDRSAHILEGAESPEKMLIETAKRLETAGADFIVMTCNTAHYFADSIKKNITVPFISIIEETGKELKRLGIIKAGLLATTGTVKAGCFLEITNDFGVELLLPDEKEQERVMKSIYEDIKPAGSDVAECDIAPLEEVIESLKNKGAQAVILGCTELPLVLDEAKTSIKCIDPTLVLAKAAIEFAGHEIKE